MKSRKLVVSPVSKFLSGKSYSQYAELCEVDPQIGQYWRSIKSLSQKTSPESRSLTVHACTIECLLVSRSSPVPVLVMLCSKLDLNTFVNLVTSDYGTSGDIY